MEFLKHFIIFSLLIVSIKSLPRFSIDDKKLSESICKITNDVMSSTIDTQDILIGNMVGETLSSTINEIAKCVNDRTAVVVSDFGRQLSEKNLRKASVIILAIDKVDDEKVIKLIENHFHSTTWHHMAKIICVMPQTATLNERLTVINVFSLTGFINVAVVHKTVYDDIRYEIANSMAGDIIFILNPQNSSSIFPDKLQNMHGYSYRVPIYQQHPQIDLRDKTRVPKLIHFLRAVGSVQNTGINLIVLNNFTYFKDFWVKRAMDLTLNTAVEIQSLEPKLLTYETQGYCSLVPIPPKTSFSNIVLYEPFDGLTWILLALSVVCSVTVWRLYRTHGAVDSHWQLAANILMVFIGQGGNFSRQKRLVLAVLLNIICLSMFLLNNLYEGALTSAMISPVRENRLKSLDDVLASNYDVMMGKLFYSKIKDEKSFAAIKSRIKVEMLSTVDQYMEEIVRQHYVFIRTCVDANYDMTYIMKSGQRLSSFYYLLPDQVLVHYVQLEASYLNPYLDRLQFFMDLSFQAGLHHIWDIYSSKSTSASHEILEEKQFLKIEDFHQIFIIFAVGLMLATLVLLIEIFTHDCLRHFSFNNVSKKVRNCMCKAFKKKKNRKVKVRKIFVKPKD